MKAGIVEIGEFRLSRQREHNMRKTGECRHLRLELEDRGDIVRCGDCGAQVSAYWALSMLADEFSRWGDRLESQDKRLREEQDKALHLIAARRIEKLWRGRKMTPLCPHCNRGILPEDGLGHAAISREIELRRHSAGQQIAQEKETL